MSWVSFYLLKVVLLFFFSRRRKFLLYFPERKNKNKKANLLQISLIFEIKALILVVPDQFLSNYLILLKSVKKQINEMWKSLYHLLVGLFGDFWLNKNFFIFLIFGTSRFFKNLALENKRMLILLSIKQFFVFKCDLFVNLKKSQIKKY